MWCGNVVIKRGTKIICPLCKRVIGEVTRDIKMGDVFDSTNIVIYGKEVKDGDPMICPYCGFPFCVETTIGAAIRTEHGWIPECVNDMVMPLLIHYLQQKGLWRKEWDKYLGR